MMTVTVPPRAPVQRSLGGYTRLMATFEVDAPDDPREYRRRSFLARYFAGKTIARLVSVKATLARPRVSTITGFTAVDYTSSRKAGESWSTDVNPVRVLTPFFRIDADSAIALEATTSATSTYQMSVAAGLLDVVKRAAKLVAPTATLITSLNKERFEDASTFVDQSLSSLLQESIVERATNDFIVKDWVGNALLTIQVWLPLGNEITPKATNVKRGEQLVYLGKWTITSTPAVLSIFSDTPLLLTNSDAPADRKKTNTRSRSVAKADEKTDSRCAEEGAEIKAACDAFRTLDPQTVLNFPVDNGVSLSQALAGDAGIAAAREHLLQNVAVKTADAGQDARALCTLVADKAHMLGFNRFDVAAILWAYASQSFVTQPAGDKLREEANCAPLKIAYSVGLPKGGFAGVEADTTLQPAPTVPPPAPSGT